METLHAVVFLIVLVIGCVRSSPPNRFQETIRNKIFIMMKALDWDEQKKEAAWKVYGKISHLSFVRAVPYMLATLIFGMVSALVAIYKVQSNWLAIAAMPASYFFCAKLFVRLFKGRIERKTLELAMEFYSDPQVIEILSNFHDYDTDLDNELRKIGYTATLHNVPVATRVTPEATSEAST